jgi:hypothetical protein
MTAALAVRTSPAMSRGAPPLIRLRSAPDPEPPYDEETGVPPDQPAPMESIAELPLDWPRIRQPAAAPATEARLAAHRYLALCLEVLGGFRPLAHLRVRSSAAAFEQIARQVTRSRAGAVPGDRVVLRQLRVCEPVAGVAEVAAVLGRAGQVWAMALRLERHHGVWLCIHLEVL